MSICAVVKDWPRSREAHSPPFTGKAPDQEFRGAAKDLSLGRVTNGLGLHGTAGLPGCGVFQGENQKVLGKSGQGGT